MLNISKSIIIECDCGTHMLRVQSEVDVYDDPKLQRVDMKRFTQDFYLAMFSYGNQKNNFWNRCVIAFKYLKTGKMFTDQLVLNSEEAKKLSAFIEENIIEADKIK